MQYIILSDDEVDETFEPVRTVQGILRMPRKRPRVNKDGTIDHTFGDWEVPDHPKWESVPGFPDFLFDRRGIPQGVVRPLTPEERSEYLASRRPAVPVAETRPSLEFVAGSTCIRIGEKLVHLTLQRYGRGGQRTARRRSIPIARSRRLLRIAW